MAMSILEALGGMRVAGSLGADHNAQRSSESRPVNPSLQPSTIMKMLTFCVQCLLIVLAAVMPLSTTHAAEDFLPPEQAFQLDARAVDAKTIEVSFNVAKGYYLYREPFKFTAEPGVQLGTAQIPAGKVKFDETFQKNVETYRGRMALRLPVRSAPSSFKLTVTSQGCADAGLCYPPMQTVVQVSLAGFGGNGSATLANAGLDVPRASSPRRSSVLP